ncbi:MAG TPA: hypothetical protein VFE53_07150 [Mucilaginibacter sp.]|jgi:hypothetical protein|nr:hypothetical protein [Mucilaginibacter sp.]
MNILRVEAFNRQSYKELADFVNRNQIKRENILSIVGPMDGVVLLYYYTDK